MSEILSDEELNELEKSLLKRDLLRVIASHRALQSEWDTLEQRFLDVCQSHRTTLIHMHDLEKERDALKAELAEAKRQTWKDAAQAYTRYRQALIPKAGDWRKPEPFDEWCLRQAHGAKP